MKGTTGGTHSGTDAENHLDIAPIDEPCETWLKDLIAWLESLS